MIPPHHSIRWSRYLLVGKLYCYEWSWQICNKLNDTVEILKDVDNDDVDMNDLAENSIKCACKLCVDSNYDLNRVHERRLVPKRLD